MKKYIQYFLLLFLPLTNLLYGQQTPLTADTTIFTSLSFESSSHRFYMPLFNSRENIIDRGPWEGDTAFIRSNKHLLKSGPDHKSYERFADLAAALWRAGQTSTAKKMFLDIERSKELYYTGTKFHSAGNTYEYGSYTSHFKNEASLHLCRIYIEEKKYQQALAYLIKADRVYKIQYNCGTGSLSYWNTLNSLYAVCYKGSGMADRMIDMYLKEDFYYDDDFTALVKKKYPQPEIERYFQLALDNITLVKDPFESTVYTRDEESDKDSLIAKYTGGSAYTVLFGRKIELPRPELQNGETITRQHFIDAFIQSRFYTSLTGKK